MCDPEGILYKPLFFPDLRVRTGRLKFSVFCTMEGSFPMDSSLRYIQQWRHPVLALVHPCHKFQFTDIGGRGSIFSSGKKDSCFCKVLIVEIVAGSCGFRHKCDLHGSWLKGDDAGFSEISSISQRAIRVSACVYMNIPYRTYVFKSGKRCGLS